MPTSATVTQRGLRMQEATIPPPSTTSAPAVGIYPLPAAPTNASSHFRPSPSTQGYRQIKEMPSSSDGSSSPTTPPSVLDANKDFPPACTIKSPKIKIKDIPIFSDIKAISKAILDDTWRTREESTDSDAYTMDSLPVCHGVTESIHAVPSDHATHASKPSTSGPQRIDATVRQKTHLVHSAPVEAALFTLTLEEINEMEASLKSSTGVGFEINRKFQQLKASWMTVHRTLITANLNVETVQTQHPIPSERSEPVKANIENLKANVAEIRQELQDISDRIIKLADAPGRTSLTQLVKPTYGLNPYPQSKLLSEITAYTGKQDSLMFSQVANLCMRQLNAESVAQEAFQNAIATKITHKRALSLWERLCQQKKPLLEIIRSISSEMDRPDTIEDLHRNLNNFVKRSDENYAQCVARLQNDVETLMAGSPTSERDATMEMAVKTKLAQIMPRPTWRKVLREVNKLKREGEPCPIDRLIEICQNCHDDDCEVELADQIQHTYLLNTETHEPPQPSGSLLTGRHTSPAMRDRELRKTGRTPSPFSHERRDTRTTTNPFVPAQSSETRDRSPPRQTERDTHRPTARPQQRGKPGQPSLITIGNPNSKARPPSIDKRRQRNRQTDVQQQRQLNDPQPQTSRNQDRAHQHTQRSPPAHSSPERPTQLHAPQGDLRNNITNRRQQGDLRYRLNANGANSRYNEEPPAQPVIHRCPTCDGTMCGDVCNYDNRHRMPAQYREHYSRPPPRSPQAQNTRRPPPQHNGSGGQPNVPDVR